MEGIEVPYSLLIPLNYSQKFVKLRYNSQICPHFLSDSSKKWQFVFEMPLCQQTETGPKGPVFVDESDD